MDQAQFEKELENIALTTRIEISERVNEAEGAAKQREAAIEKKVDALRQLAIFLGALAVIFGLSGAWGFKMLSTARAELASLNSTLGEISDQVNDWDALRTRYASELEELKTMAVDEARAEIAASTKRSRGEISKAVATELSKIETEVLPTVKTRKLEVVDGNGTVVFRVFHGQKGGVARAFTTDGKKLATIGSDVDGDGGIWLFDHAERLGFNVVRSTHLHGYVLNLRNLDTDERVVSMGTDSEGDGGFWLRNQVGKLAANATTGTNGGYFRVYSTLSSGESTKVGSFGTSNSSKGGVWLYDADDKEIFRAP